MKKILFYFSLIFFLNITNAISENKIAFIDMDNVIKKSNIGKLMLMELDKLNNANITQLKLKENELKKKEDEIKMKKNILSEEESQKEIEKLKKKINNYRNLKNEMVSNYNKTKNERLNFFFEQINPIIQNFMDKNSINILLERKNIFIGSNNSDITSSIIEEINNNFKQ